MYANTLFGNPAEEPCSNKTKGPWGHEMRVTRSSGNVFHDLSVAKHLHKQPLGTQTAFSGGQVCLPPFVSTDYESKCQISKSPCSIPKRVGQRSLIKSCLLEPNLPCWTLTWRRKWVRKTHRYLRTHARTHNTLPHHYYKNKPMYLAAYNVLQLYHRKTISKQMINCYHWFHTVL